jgi:hypothetical protein
MSGKRHLPCNFASAERNGGIERISGKTGMLSTMRNLAKVANFAGGVVFGPLLAGNQWGSNNAGVRIQ